MLNLAGLRSTNPPLGLITVAAMVASDWKIELCAQNIRHEIDED